MRRSILTLVTAVLALSACTKNPEKGTPLTPLAPDENKAKMEQIAIDLVNQVNPDDFTEFIDAINYLGEIGMPEDLMPGETETPDPDPMGRRAPEFGMLSFIGNFTAMATRAADFAVQNFYGRYVYNEETEEWSAEESDTELRLVYPFDGTTVNIAIEATGATTTVSVYGETIDVPAKTTAKMTKGDATLANITIDVVSIASDARACDVNLTLDLNGYKFETKAKADSSNANSTITISKAGKKLVVANASAAGSNIFPSEWSEDGLDEWAGKFGRVNATINVLDRAWLKGSSGNLQKYLDGLYALEDEYYDEEAMEWIKSYDQSYADRATSLFKDNIRVYMNYDGSDNAEATLERKTIFYFDEEWGENSIYTENYLVFASDGSKFSFEEFFDEDGFADLFDALEDIFAFIDEH